LKIVIDYHTVFSVFVVKTIFSRWMKSRGRWPRHFTHGRAVKQLFELYTTLHISIQSNIDCNHEHSTYNAYVLGQTPVPTINVYAE